MSSEHAQWAVWYMVATYAFQDPCFMSQRINRSSVEIDRFTIHRTNLEECKLPARKLQEGNKFEIPPLVLWHEMAKNYVTDCL